MQSLRQALRLFTETIRSTVGLQLIFVIKIVLYCVVKFLFHVSAQNGEPSECSPEGRWERPVKYTLMKVDRKSAVKLYDDKQEALSAIKGKDH